MPQQQSTGVTDILCPYGGFVKFDATCNPVLVRDTTQSPDATQQNIEVALMTNPTLSDLDGTAIGRPDNLFHPDYGAGLKAAIGRNPSPTLDAGIKSRVLKALADNPAVAQTPLPTVTTTAVQGQYYVLVKATTTTGLPFTISHAGE